MAHGGDLFALGNGVPSEQNFEIAFRGYKQDQVDNFVRLLETDLAAYITGQTLSVSGGYTMI